MSAARELSEVLVMGGVTRDPFSPGDVLRWTTHSGYTYAALCTPVGWFTTARSENMYVRQNYQYLDLVKMLSKKDVSHIEVSSGWTEVR